MEYQVYVQKTQHASELVKIGAYAEAEQLLTELTDSNISDVDKSIMAYNLAVVAEKQNDTQKALYWYDQGILYETPHCRFTVTEKKAEFLYKCRMLKESRAIYETLRRQPYLTEGDKERIRHKLAAF